MSKRAVQISIVAIAIITIVIIYYVKSANSSLATWHMINVNQGKLQGDANLLIVDGVVIMIDAGYSSEAKTNVLPYLQSLKIRKIDHFFISHPHRDHYEGLGPIYDSGIQISNLYYKIPSNEIQDCCYSKKDFLKFIQYAKDHGTKLIRPKTGFSLTIGGNARIDILHAQEGNLPNAKLDVNDLSLIMKLSLSNGSTILFPGDLNQNLGNYLTGNKMLQSDFLKMPHHGIAGIAPNSFFDTVAPSYVLVPGPKHLWCSERGSQARNWTNSKKIPTWVNGINGNIVVEFTKEKVTITPEIVNGECKLKEFGVVKEKITKTTSAF